MEKEIGVVDVELFNKAVRGVFSACNDEWQAACKTMSRVSALNLILRNKKAKKWVKAGKDYIALHPALLDVAATTPLEIKRKCVFDKDIFFNQVAEIAKSKYPSLRF